MDLFPPTYRNRPLHDDWPWPFCYIPRRWTGLPLCMPPLRVCGTAQYRAIPLQPDYPLAPDAVKIVDSAGIAYVMGMDPVPPIGQWSIQSVYSRLLRRRVPCFLSFSVMFFGKRLHFNGPLKPDVTTGDWWWWIECSLSWTKISA